MLSEHPTELTPGVAALIAQLHARDQHVYFVSGGFRQMIEPVAAQVNVRKDQIFANTLLFNDDGSFKSHLDSEPTSRAGGKAKVVADLKAAHGYKTVVMVGDGATDMEARDIEGERTPSSALAALPSREKVKAGADWFVSDFSAMISAIAPTDADGIWKLTEEDRSGSSGRATARLSTTRASRPPSARSTTRCARCRSRSSARRRSPRRSAARRRTRRLRSTSATAASRRPRASGEPLISFEGGRGATSWPVFCAKVKAAMRVERRVCCVCDLGRGEARLARLERPATV